MNDFALAALLILIISMIVAGISAGRKPVEKPVKVMIFVAYFWLLAFLQLTLYALFRYFWLPN